eukprot:SAG25_NODE_2080_length_1977_cov_1.718850_1_plen_36_part_10
MRADLTGDGALDYDEFCHWLVLLPDVHPRAVFDEFL